MNWREELVVWRLTDRGLGRERENGGLEEDSRTSHPELESLVSKLRRKGFSYRKISDLLKEEYGLSVSFMSVREIIKDIEWMRKEKRNLKRRKFFFKTV